MAPGAYFQAWDWGEIEKKAGRAVWRIAVVDPTSRSILAVSQIVKVQARRGTFLHVRHGPVCPKLDKKVFSVWVSWIRALGKKEGAWFVRISPLVDPQNQPFFSAFSFQPAPIHSMDAEMVTRLDLAKTDEELLSGMRKTTRNLIRRAEKEQVIIKETNTINDFLHLYKKTADRHHFVPHTQIESEYQFFKKNGNATILSGYHGDECIASAVIISFGNQAMYRHGASIRSKIPVAYALQWKAVAWARKQHVRYYNFWGIADSNRPNHPWWGLTQFKLGFGGEIVSHLHAEDMPLTPYYYFTYAIEKIRKIKRGY